MNVKILAQNIVDNPKDFTSEEIEKSFEDYAKLRLFGEKFSQADYFKTEAETVKEEYVIHKEPRMIKEDFEYPIAMVAPKPKAMDKLILLIKLPKGTKREAAEYSAQSRYEDIIHYVTIGNNDYMEVEVLSKPPNEMSILWGLFKWTYR